MKVVEYAEKANEVFVLSDSFIRIKELIDDERSTIDDIAEVILIDPALSATILKLANSSFFNYPGKIDTVSKAVLVLGITEVYNLVIAYFTTDAFKSIEADAAYLEEYWECSVDCALLVKHIGSALGLPNAERLFILGLLHSLGELVVKQFEPDLIESCWPKDIKQMPWEVQSQQLGFTFAECTAELLKLWQLPFSIIEPIRYQDAAEVGEQPKDAQILYIAKRVMLKNNRYPREALSNFVTEEQLESLELTEYMINSAVTYCDMERLGVLSILKPSAVMIY